MSPVLHAICYVTLELFLSGYGIYFHKPWLPPLTMTLVNSCLGLSCDFPWPVECGESDVTLSLDLRPLCFTLSQPFHLRVDSWVLQDDEWWGEAWLCCPRWGHPRPADSQVMRKTQESSPKQQSGLPSSQMTTDTWMGPDTTRRLSYETEAWLCNSGLLFSFWVFCISSYKSIFGTFIFQEKIFLEHF